MTTVLVAEDDPDIRELVKFKLEQDRFTVLDTDDGPSTLTAAREHQPEIVVLDISLPGMSGLEVCRTLRAQPETQRMLVLMLTARAQEADVDKGFQAGADDYLSKPFSPRELAARVRALLARASR